MIVGAEPGWCTALCDQLKSDEKAECAKCGCSNCKGRDASCKCQGTVHLLCNRIYGTLAVGMYRQEEDASNWLVNISDRRRAMV